MAFCKYCGKELQDGEVCTCQESVAAAQAASAAEAAPVPEAAPAPQAASATEAAPAPETASAPQAAPAGGTSGAGAQVPSIDTEKLLGSVKEAAKGFLNIFARPATAGREFVANTNLTASLFIIIVQVLLSSFFALILAARINSMVRKTLGLAASFLGMGTKVTVISGAKAFFLTLLFSILASGLLLLLFLLASLILKAQASWKQLVALVAVRSVAIAPFILLSWFLALINPIVGTCLFFGSFLLAMTFLQESVKGIEGFKDNKALYAVFIVMIIFILVCYFVLSKTAGWFLSSSITDFIGNSSNLLDLFF